MAFSPTYYELDYNSNYDLINYISILPRNNIYPSLARSTTYTCDNIYTRIGYKATKEN
jgi:hypothetical protein